MKFLIIAYSCLIFIYVNAQTHSEKEIRPGIEALRTTLAGADIIFRR